MQETANLQAVKHDMPFEKLREVHGKGFILSRLGLRMYRPLNVYDEIRVETWPCESKGVSFLRCAQLFKGDILAAEMSSVWALVDIRSKTLCQVNDFTFPFDTHEPLELDMPSRVRIPRDMELSLLGEKTVFYADADLNGHMHNTSYLDLFCDFLPDMTGRYMVSAAVSFMAEAKLGETVKIYRAESDGTYYFRTVKENGAVGVEAQIVLDDIN